MGKKHRLKQNEKFKPKVNLAAHEKKQILIHVEELFSKCITKVNPQKEWDFYVQLYESVENLRKKQSAALSPNCQNKVDRLSFLPAFISWLNTTGAVWKNIEICDYGSKQGFGIKAVNDIKADDLLVSIPRTAMITHEDIICNSYLNELIQSNEILSQMPNVCLALYLHCEIHNPYSNHKPYIDLFPREFNTTLYFTPDEMKFLKGSPVLSAAINHYKSIIRQFCLIYKLFNGVGERHPRLEKIDSAARERFTFDSYRWCVSVVSTRQNQIPIKSCGEPGNTEQTTLALIPFWDMFNHRPGPMSTVYDVAGDQLESYAMASFKQGDQVTICYGSRNNADLLIHNGFVLGSNPVGRELHVSLGVSHQDPLKQMKTLLLRRLNSDVQGMFSVAPSHGDFPASRELLAFLRIFHMNEDELRAWLEKSDEEILELADSKLFAQSTFRHDAKICKFLEDRLTLLRKSRDRWCGGDPRQLLGSEELSERARLCLAIQGDECAIMEECAEMCRTMMESCSVSPEKN